MEPVFTNRLDTQRNKKAAMISTLGIVSRETDVRFSKYGTKHAHFQLLAHLDGTHYIVRPLAKREVNLSDTLQFISFTFGFHAYFRFIFFQLLVDL